MNIFLIHNRGAGSGEHSEDHLLESIAAEGHNVVPLELGTDLPAEAPDMLVVAGGDGTVEKVIHHYYQALVHNNVALGIIPVGTANNIGQSLSITGSVSELAQHWKAYEQGERSRVRPLAIGKATFDAQVECFVESVGCGLLSHAILLDERCSGSDTQKPRDPKQAVSHRIARMRSSLSSFASSYYRLNIDGQKHDGDYLLLEVLNISRIGPGLEFSPGADPGDDQLDLLLVRSEQREDLDAFLAAAERGERPHNPFQTLSGRRIEITSPARRLHIDDTVLQSHTMCQFSLEIAPDKLIVVR